MLRIVEMAAAAMVSLVGAMERWRGSTERSPAVWDPSGLRPKLSAEWSAMKVRVVALRERIVMERMARRARDASRMARWRGWEVGMVDGEERGGNGGCLGCLVVVVDEFAGGG